MKRSIERKTVIPMPPATKTYSSSVSSGSRNEPFGSSTCTSSPTSSSRQRLLERGVAEPRREPDDAALGRRGRERDVAAQALLVVVAAVRQLDPEVRARPVVRIVLDGEAGRRPFPSRPGASRRSFACMPPVYESAGENDPFCVLDHLGLRRRRPHQLLDPLEVRHPACAQPLDRGVEVVGRPAQLDVRAEQRPVGVSRLGLVRQADAARVEQPVSPTLRSYCMCVCAVTMHAASTPAVNSATRAAGVSTVTHSSSLRGEPWQKSVAPRPVTSTVTVGCVRSR